MSRPVVLLLDNHSTRYDADTLEMARGLGVIIKTYPPNATPLLQVLDVSCFGPFKHKRDESVNEHLLSGHPVTKLNILGNHSHIMPCAGAINCH
jgi:hypothetical protein